jgi:hypothetical protein
MLNIKFVIREESELHDDEYAIGADYRICQETNGRVWVIESFAILTKKSTMKNVPSQSLVTVLDFGHALHYSSYYQDV